MTLKNRWIEAFYTLSTGSRKLRNLLTPLGVLFFGLLISLLIVTARAVDRWLGLSGLFPRPYSLILGACLILVAAVLIGWSVLHFLKARGTPVPANPPPRLVTAGPYAFTRNPMLTGVFALLFGIGAWFGSTSLIILFTPLFILLNVWELKAIEEPELVRRLGADYREYRSRTPMFIPSLGRLVKKIRSPRQRGT